MRGVSILLFCTILFITPLYASFRDCGAIFLTIFPGTEAVGMGGAYVSIGSDATACYYNPAALGFHRTVNVSIMNTSAPPGLGYLFMKSWADITTKDSENDEPEWLEKLYPDMHYKYIGFVYPISENAGSFAVAYDYLSTGECMVTDENGDPIGLIFPYDYALSVSYGLAIRNIVGIGVSSKYIYSFVGSPEIVWKALDLRSGDDYSLAFDAGLLLKTPKIPFLSLGLAYQNVGKKIFDSPLPKLLRKGFCIEPIYFIDEVFKNDTGYKISNFINVKYTKDWITCLVKREGEESSQTWEASGWQVTFYNTLSFRNGEFVDREGARVGKTNGIALKLGLLDFEMADDSDIYVFPTKNFRVQLNIHEVESPSFWGKSEYRDMAPIFASLIIPGAGHLLKGKKETGSILLVSSVILGYATWELKDNGNSVFYVPLLSLAGLYGYSIWDLLGK